MINIPLDQILQTITYTKLLITFEAIDNVELPPYKGATFRGSLGHAFRRLVCTYPGLACEKCRLKRDCLFALMYSKPLASEHPAFGRFTLPPRPYIINPMSGNETKFLPGSQFWFELILIGDAVKKLLPVLPAVFNAMGEGGIGKGRGRFRPVSLQHSNINGVFEPLPAIGQPHTLQLFSKDTEPFGKSLTLRFDNPLRLLSDRKPMKEPPEFNRIIGNLAMRMTLLANVYCGSSWLDYTQIEELESEYKIINHNLEWVDWRHFSGTKKINMNFDGHIGSISYGGEFGQWTALIRAGEILHAGSTATFGLGKYTIVLHE
jgi:hypothetical protein